MHSRCSPGGILDTTQADARRVIDLGVLCRFAADLPAYRSAPFGGLMHLWRSAQNVGQLKVYMNGYQQCVGFAVWALLSPELEAAFIDGGPRMLNEWEINEGTSPWVLDLAAAPGSLSYVLEDLRDTVFAEYPHVSYVRVRRGTRLCKRISRDDRSSFVAAARHRSHVA